MTALLPSRGEIWFVDLDPIRGHEQGRQRPALVVSTNGFNYGPARLLVVAPLTSRIHSNIIWRILVHPPEGGLRPSSHIMCDMLRSISHERLLDGRPLGRVSANTLAEVEERIRILLELEYQE